MSPHNPPKYQLGLIGWPIEFSLSPLLHKAALQHLNLAGDYKLYPIPSLPSGEKSLSRILSRMKNGEIDGLNVTVPHKQSIIPLLDGLTATAQGIGAVNTLKFQAGALIGDNTDAQGFLNDLRKSWGAHSFGPGKTALILGAGGAAHAVGYALRSEGWRLIIAARRLEQAQAICRKMAEGPGEGQSPSPSVRATMLDAAGLAGISPALIVNTTPVGSQSYPHDSPWPGPLLLPQNAFIYDLVYNPTNTEFTQQARRAGLSARGGMGMLVEQARLSFEMWTGRLVPREIMQAAL